MMLKLGGVVDTSTIDYPGKLCSVVFLHGCNFRCGFCFNSDLINAEAKEIVIKDLVSEIKKIQIQ